MWNPIGWYLAELQFHQSYRLYMIYINFGYVIVGRLFLNHIWDISINQIFNVGYIYIPAIPSISNILCWMGYPTSSARWLFQIRTKPPWLGTRRCPSTMDWWQREKTWKNSNFLTRKYHHKLVDSIPWMIPLINATG